MAISLRYCCQALVSTLCHSPIGNPIGNRARQTCLLQALEAALAANIETKDNDAEPAQCKNTRLVRVVATAGLGEIELNPDIVHRQSKCALVNVAWHVILRERAVDKTPAIIVSLHPPGSKQQERQDPYRIRALFPTRASPMKATLTIMSGRASVQAPAWLGGAATGDLFSIRRSATEPDARSEPGRLDRDARKLLLRRCGFATWPCGYGCSLCLAASSDDMVSLYLCTVAISSISSISSIAGVRASEDETFCDKRRTGSSILVRFRASVPSRSCACQRCVSAKRRELLEQAVRPLDCASFCFPEGASSQRDGPRFLY